MSTIYKRKQSEPLERLITEFANKYNLDLSNNLDLISICSRLGISVKCLCTQEQGFDGFILINEDYKIIGINDRLSPLDRRFLIARELGHYICADSKHEKTLALKDCLNQGADKNEQECAANYLAAALLVPIEQFKAELDLFDIHNKKFKSEKEVIKLVPNSLVRFLAKRYRVNEQLIIKRIVEVSEYD